MKKIIITFLSLLIVQVTVAQSPTKFNYQAIVRNASNVLLTNQSVGLKVSILQGTPTGTSVYEETHSLTTNSGGLITAEVGSGTVVSGSIATINWSNGPFYIKNEIDPTGGTTYTVTSTSELLSVPYTLHAKTADSLSGGIAEQDPQFNASVAAAITTADTANWNNKLSTEVDGSITNEIQSLSLSNDTLYLSNANNVFIGGGGTSGASLWSANGSNIYTDTSNVKIGRGVNTAFYQAQLTVGDTGVAQVMIGHSGNYNEVNSGKLIFTEDVDANGTCGFEFQLNGSDNTLSLVSGCTTLGDTSIVFTRTGDVRIPKRVRVGGGYVGNPSATLDVVQAGNLSASNGLKLSVGGATNNWTVGMDASSNLGFAYNGTLRGSINNATGAYAASSDISLKKNISTLPSVLERVNKLRATKYQYLDNDESESFSIGFIAQEVEPLFPEAVTLAGNDKKAIFYDYFSVIAIKAIQEQSEVIAQQKDEIEQLKSALELINNRLLELENNK